MDFYRKTDIESLKELKVTNNGLNSGPKEYYQSLL